MKRSPNIIFLFLLLFAGCIQIPDMDWNPGNPEEGGGSQVDPNQNAELTYFAFLKEDNPQLAQDVVCFDTKATDLVMVMPSELDYPCSLIPRFDVSNGAIEYMGNGLKSGESELLCSTAEPAQIKIVGGKTVKYHNVAVVPYTGLPVMVVTTDKYKSITSRKEWKKAAIRTCGLGQLPDTFDSVYVRKRGNGTASFPKVSFNVKYPKRKAVLGMKKHKRWCFMANYRDRTLIRNEVAFFLGNNIFDNLEWTPHAVFAEVVIDGKHQGVYHVTEQIRVDKHRVDIDEMTADDNELPGISGGYLLEIDEYYDAANKFKTPINTWKVNIKSPKADVCTEAQEEYIKSEICRVEAMLDAGEFEELYAKYMDLDSFVDYYIVETLTNNKELKNKYSVYCYKKRDGKLYAGPLWDFEYSTFNEEEGVSNSTSVWYKYLFKDPIFKAALKARWNEKKPTLESEVLDHIAKEQQLLTVSAHIDETIIEKNQNEKKNGDETLTFEKAVAKMSRVISSRIIYMDKLINDL